MIFSALPEGIMRIGDQWVRCALGRGGVIAQALKAEGDGASPAGVWPLRRVLYRPDRRPAPRTALPAQPIAPDDGWCDDPADLNYNRPVAHPYPGSAERLWREDGVYDLVVVLGYNDDPVVPGKGSAIFMHLARPDYAPTEGCVALARADLEALLARAKPGDAVEIKA
jgi:L,D-peptidoglycan transpeptidase YkuD (ErfK/YbiS/YcfS/YnhG family)